MRAGKIVLSTAIAAAVLLGASPRASRGSCFDAADLYRLRLAVDVAISPDGGWVAFIVAEPPDTLRGERRSHGDLWIAPADGSRPPRRYASGPSMERMPRWSPDGWSVAFLSDRDESGTAQVWVVRRNGGEPRKITGFGEGVGFFAWSPEGRRLAVTVVDTLSAATEAARARGDDERVVDQDDRFARLRIVDLETGAGDAVTPPGLHVTSAAWSPGGERIAIVVADRPTSGETYWNGRLEILSLRDGERTALAGHAVGTPSWSPGGEQIAFELREAHPEITVPAPLVGVVPAGGGEVRRIGARHAGAFRAPRWLPDGEHIAVFEMAGVRGTLSVVAVEDGEVDRREELLVPYSFLASPFDVSADGRCFAFLRGSASKPPEVWADDGGWFGGPKRLTDLNPWLGTRQLPDMRVVRWTSRDGTAVEGVLVTSPDAKRDGRGAAVVIVHGGPSWAWWLGWHGTWHEWAIPLACRGFTVLLPNPRGSVGYGTGFARANFDDWGGGDFEDVMAGADLLVDEGWADPARIGIGGWSYGGYMAAWAVTQTDRFAAAVVGAGVTDLFSFHGTTDITPQFLEQYLRDVPYRRPEAYRNRSAVEFVARASTPTLVLHGAADVRVPAGQGYELYRGLRQTGTETELVVYPREGHGFGEIRHQVDLVERIVDWYERRLR
ncbi:MAG: S9 family peptidase [Candidatus Krumholzibacteriota bacterium]|nr:S9 family peptidase [Candidatus Krumholzibacteriota bacterium]